MGSLSLRAGEFAYGFSMQVHTIDLEFQGIPGVIAAFVVEGDHGAVLFETGPATCAETLRAKIKALGFDPAAFSGIFVTHIHLDHAGGAGAFAKERVPLYVHPKGSQHLINPSRLTESARMVYGDEFDLLWGEMTPVSEDGVYALGDGEAIFCGGLTIEAIETPGHAFHHHSFLVNGSVLFAGDAAGARLDDSGFISVTSAPPQFHLEHTLASLDRLRDLNVERVFLTHFGEVPNPDSHWIDYRDAVELNATFVQQRINEGMDEESLRIAYQAFQMEQAFRANLPRDTWERFQSINGTAMCADGIRIYWEKKAIEAS